jgi:predicted aspartyl protease
MELVLRATPAGETKIRIRLLVDTGSTYSWIRERTLRRLGITPFGRLSFTTISGRKVTREVGGLWMEWKGRRGPTTVVFAQPKDEQVLGLHALEGMALQVDPANKRIVKSRSVLAV